MASKPPGKRKQPPGSTSGRSMDKKRQKRQDARTIAVQTSGDAFKNGEVDVEKFVQAREYEIQALEDGMGRARKALKTRAFQDVPRDLRRRTASHNVKKVPKRLRARAREEMMEDNTPTVQSRRRKPTPHQRLRLDTAARLRQLHAAKKSNLKQSKQPKPSQPSGDLLDATVTVHPESDSIEPQPETIKIHPGSRRKRMKKEGLQDPPVPPARFRKRQRYKSWLPTHMFHAKRAHMTPPNEPLWRHAIPITPTMKSYRPTHRTTKTRGAMAWDMSYMSTIGLRGQYRSIRSLLQALGVGTSSGSDGCWLRRGRKWRDGRRTWHGWMFEQQGWPTKPIAPVTVLWNQAPQSHHDGTGGDADAGDAGRSSWTGTELQDRQLFIRVHPAAFLQLWTEVVNLSKVQNPSVAVEDLRFEIGSIEIMGSAATEALVAVLTPILSESDLQQPDAPEHVWKTMSALSNPACLPPDPLLAMNVSDPRLRHPRRPIQSSSEPTSDTLVETIADWPSDRCSLPSDLFDRNRRSQAVRSMPSQKSINRRKSQANPGESPETLPRDPAIPTILFTSGLSDGQAKWTVLLPWKWVLPVWYSLMHYPLSSGGNVRFGGLEQLRQVAFESGTPWFPGDFPGTKAGSLWEAEQGTKRQLEWNKRPKGKRIEWSSVDLKNGTKGEIGDGWACDWPHLGRTFQTQASNQAHLYHLQPQLAVEILRGKSQKPGNNNQAGLVTIKVTLVGRGVLRTCGRIYRLPTSDPSLRQSWLSLQRGPTIARVRFLRKDFPLIYQFLSDLPAKDDIGLPPVAKHAPDQVKRQWIAQKLLTKTAAQPGDSNYPAVPPDDDLIGFITTGNFNLAEGISTALGSLLADKVSAFEGQKGSEQYLCIVRDSGQATGRLARWEVALT